MRSRLSRASLLIAALVVALMLAACSDATPTTSPRITVRITHAGNAQTNYGRGAQRFTELAAAKTGGRVQVEISTDLGIAGGDNVKALDMLQKGDIEATLHSNLIYAGIEPRMEVFSLPYVMASRDNAYKAVDGPAGQELLKGLEQKGIVGLAYGENGFRQLTNAVRPITRPQDMAGLKVRVPETRLYVDTVRALGAEPVVMTFTGVYDALKARTIDGQENPLSIIYPSRLYEVQRYLTVWDYSWDTVVLGFNKAFWDKLPSDVRSALRDAARESMLYMRDQVRGDDGSLLEELKKQGMEVAVLTTDQKKAFVDATAPLYAVAEGRIGKALMDQVRRTGQGG